MKTLKQIYVHVQYLKEKEVTGMAQWRLWKCPMEMDQLWNSPDSRKGLLVTLN